MIIVVYAFFLNGFEREGGRERGRKRGREKGKEVEGETSICCSTYDFIGWFLYVP